MESTDQTPVETAVAASVTGPSLANGRLLLTHVEQEIEAVEAVSSYLNPSALQCAVHLQRAGRLLHSLFKLDGKSEADFGEGLISCKALRIEDKARFDKVWGEINTVQSYSTRPEDGDPLVTEDDIYSVVRIFRKALRSFESKYKAKGILGLFGRSPSLLLLVFIPVLFYAVGFVYTKSLNPLTWFKTGLEDFSVQGSRQDWGALLVNRGVSGQALQIGGQRYLTGYGTHANSKIQINFNKAARILSGACGVDDGNKKGGSVVCIIEANKKELFRSGTLTGKTAAARFSVPVEGLAGVELIITDAGDGRDYDHADWVDLKLE